MLAKIFFPLLIVLASPELNVQKNNLNPKILSIEVTGKDSIVKECLDNGQEIRYRFEIKVCDAKYFWGNCSKTMVETHFLSWNPISNSYQIITDRHRDQKLPEGQTFEHREQALIALRTMEDFNLEFFKKANLTPTSYLQARGFSECRGEYSKTFSELSYYLTLGFLRLSGFSTGWKNFPLNLK